MAKKKPAPVPLRKCGTCGADVGPDRPDACFGMLPGVIDACCGHGFRRRAYLHWANGLIIRGFQMQKHPNRIGERVEDA